MFYVKNRLMCCLSKPSIITTHSISHPMRSKTELLIFSKINSIFNQIVFLKFNRSMSYEVETSIPIFTIKCLN